MRERKRFQIQRSNYSNNPSIYTTLYCYHFHQEISQTFRLYHQTNPNSSFFQSLIPFYRNPFSFAFKKSPTNPKIDSFLSLSRNIFCRYQKIEGPSKGLSPAPKNLNSGEKDRNENDCDSQHHMNAKMQTPKKPMAKHFMSPTISATSKVSVRKKVLGDRNGTPPFLDTHSQKGPTFDSRNDVSGRFSPKAISSYGFASESDDDEKSGVTAYDPSSSYLSPRPKYLRYDPNRRHEVVLQLDNRRGKERDTFGVEESDFRNVVDEEVSSSDDQDSLNPSVGNSFMKAEIEENKMNYCLNVLDSEKGTSQGVMEKHVYIDEVEENRQNEIEEEFEEEAEQDEEVQGWTLKGVMQSRKLRSSKSENEENKINNCLDINRSDSLYSENGTSQGVVKKPNYKDVEEENDNVEVEDFNGEAEQYKEVQGWSSKGIMKFLVVLSILVLATFFAFSIDSTVLITEEVTAGAKDGYSSIQEQMYEDMDMCLLKDIEEVVMESDHEQVGWNYAQPIEDKWREQFNDQLTTGSADSINGSEMETEVEWNEDVHALEEEWHNFSDQQIVSAIAESTDPSVGSELKGRKEQSGIPKYDEETVAHEYVENHSAAEESQAQPSELLVGAGMVESETINWISEPVGDKLEEDTTVRQSPLPGKEDTIIVAESIKNKATRSSMLIGMIIALFSMISGSFVFIYRSKGRKALKMSKIKPIEKLVIAEEPCLVTPKVEADKIEKLAEPPAASSLLDFPEQASKELGQIRSPTALLLGELVREVERSLRRCDQKVYDELVESEESNNFQERNKKARAVCQITSPPALENSVVDSPSCYGSFTTEANILKKENGKDAEITTPVRRSSRIHNRSVTPFPKSCSSAI